MPALLPLSFGALGNSHLSKPRFLHPETRLKIVLLTELPEGLFEIIPAKIVKDTEKKKYSPRLKGPCKERWHGHVPRFILKTPGDEALCTELCRQERPRRCAQACGQRWQHQGLSWNHLCPEPVLCRSSQWPWRKRGNQTDKGLMRWILEEKGDSPGGGTGKGEQGPRAERASVLLCERTSGPKADAGSTEQVPLRTIFLP